MSAVQDSTCDGVGVVTDWHITRLWDGGDKKRFGPHCPCAEAPCGFVTPDQECPEHGFKAYKTMRGGHTADSCPGGAK